jgi:hypothetical protein
MDKQPVENSDIQVKNTGLSGPNSNCGQRRPTPIAQINATLVANKYLRKLRKERIAKDAAAEARSVMDTRRRVEYEASRGSSGSAAPSPEDASGVEGRRKPWHNGK